jgi:hypothetical protein
LGFDHSLLLLATLASNDNCVRIGSPKFCAKRSEGENQANKRIRLFDQVITGKTSIEKVDHGIMSERKTPAVQALLAFAVLVLVVAGIPTSVDGVIRQEGSARASRFEPGPILYRRKTWELQQTRSLHLPRGGSDDEFSDAASSDDDDGVALASNGRTVLNLPKKVAVFFGKVTLGSIKALGRGLQAAFQGSDEGEDVELGIATQIFRGLKRMVSAAWNSPGTAKDDAEDKDEAAEKAKKLSPKGAKSVVAKTRTRNSDFGEFLSSSYRVNSSRAEVERPSPVLGGNIVDALKASRANGRLLLVLIPASKPGELQADTGAIEAFLSAEVSSVAEKKARKGQTTGSFTLWSAKAGSPEAIAAIKRLKAQPTGSKGQKRPILVVAYLAQVIDKQGISRMVPRLLAQHHCSPPPSAEMMVAWLNALRKRHAKQYTMMHTELRELGLHKERVEGYKGSVQSDIGRQERELQKREERLARENAEKKRQAAVQERRQMLLESLPNEPGSEVADAKTVALRFSDGRSGRRRFASSEALGTIFDWVDAMFDLERETVVLTTMNGQNSFTYDVSEMTLAEAGLSKMIGLRVSRITLDSKGDED